MINVRCFNILVLKETTYKSIDEFKRSGNLERLFPLLDNIEYYSQFISKDKRNAYLWEKMATINN